VPFTPLHMGPGLALKAVGGHRFSLLVFGFAQVAMDVEPLVGILRDAEILHGWTHGYLGAALIGLLVWLIAPWPSRRIQRWWNAQLDAHGFGWLACRAPIDRLSAATGAFGGTFSHVALDSLMHADMMPWAPWSQENALLGLGPSGSLETACLLAGIFGALAWVAQGWRRRPRYAGAAPAASADTGREP